MSKLLEEMAILEKNRYELVNDLIQNMEIIETETKKQFKTMKVDIMLVKAAIQRIWKSIERNIRTPKMKEYRTEKIFKLYQIQGPILFDGVLEFLFEGQVRNIDECMQAILELENDMFNALMEYLQEE